MIQTRSLATFTTGVTVLVLFVASFSTIQSVRGTQMTVRVGGAEYTDCLAAHSYGTWSHVINLDPSGKTWSVSYAIGLSGGDNTQYVYWSFTLYDNGNSGTTLAQDDNSAVYWEGQWPVEIFNHGGSMAGSASGTITIYSYISNDDSEAQCFVVWFYAAYY